MVRMIARSVNVRKEKDLRLKAELHLSVRQWQRVPLASVFSYILLAVHSSASKNPQSLTIIFWPLLENLKKMLVGPHCITLSGCSSDPWNVMQETGQVMNSASSS